MAGAMMGRPKEKASSACAGRRDLAIGQDCDVGRVEIVLYLVHRDEGASRMRALRQRREPFGVGYGLRPARHQEAEFLAFQLPERGQQLLQALYGRNRPRHT